jgi:hypothetical protein
MQNVAPRDLFAPIPKKIRRPPKPRMFNKFIPSRSDWKDKHGSWAVAQGIVKIDKE